MVYQELARFSEYLKHVTELNPTVSITTGHLENLAEYLGHILRNTGAKVERDKDGGIMVTYKTGTLTYRFEELT